MLQIVRSVPSPRKMVFIFGAACGPVIDNDAPYRQLYVDHAKIITSDIALKMSRVAPKAGPLQFEAADHLHQFCLQHKIAMRGHCLIWNEWVPQWIKAMTNAEREKFFDSYIDEVIGRYAGKFQSWDIVNEPFWPESQGARWLSPRSLVRHVRAKLRKTRVPARWFRRQAHKVCAERSAGRT